MTRRLTALAACALLAVLLPHTPASAEIRSFTDPAGDAGGLQEDIGRVVVQHAPSFVRVTVFPPRSRPRP